MFSLLDSADAGGGGIIDTLTRNNNSLFGWFQRNPQQIVPPNDQQQGQSDDQANLEETVVRTNLPYFMKEGTNQPEKDKHPRTKHLFPEEDPEDDRIIGESSVLSLILINVKSKGRFKKKLKS